jgi:proteic killer suppression protein
MKVEFANEHLALIRTNQAHKLGLPIAVTKACRDKILILESASTELTLRGLRGLRYKKLEGTELRQIRINEQYRIRFLLNTDTAPTTITINFIGDPH